MHLQTLCNEPVIWVNARFLTRRVTGVERVAREILNALVRDQLDADGRWHGPLGVFRFHLLAPRTHTPLENPWPALPLTQAGLFDGHAWEQFDLPRLTRGSHLLNLCNTGPLFKRLQWMFLHDAQTFAIPENFTWGLRHWYRTMFKVTGRLSLGVLTNSHFSASELTRHVGIQADRLHVAHLGVDHIDSVAPELSTEQAGLLATLVDRPFVLAVSSDNPNKNFGAVVRALELLGDAAPPCVIVGPRNDRVFAQSRLDASRVHRLGYVSDAELVALYQQAGVLVYPSFYEGFGLPPLEAMWHGCPVIAARTSALPEICADAAEYCDAHDARTLAQSIQGVLGSEERQQTLRKRGQTHARQFQWRSTVNHVLACLEKGLASAKG